jgi:hypothetical protein
MTFLILLYIFLGFYFGICTMDRRIHPSENNTEVKFESSIKL